MTVVTVVLVLSGLTVWAVMVRPAVTAVTVATRVPVVRPVSVSVLAVWPVTRAPAVMVATALMAAMAATARRVPAMAVTARTALTVVLVVRAVTAVARVRAAPTAMAVPAPMAGRVVTAVTAPTGCPTLAVMAVPVVMAGRPVWVVRRARVWVRRAPRVPMAPAVTAGTRAMAVTAGPGLRAAVMVVLVVRAPMAVGW